jgi:hypothetical protein
LSLKYYQAIRDVQRCTCGRVASDVAVKVGAREHDHQRPRRICKFESLRRVVAAPRVERDHEVGGRTVPRHHMTLCRPPWSGLPLIVITPSVIVIGRDVGRGSDGRGFTSVTLPLAGIVIASATIVAQKTTAPAPGGQQQPGGRGGRGGGIQQSPFSTPPIRIYLYAGLKTHAEGQHDYPQFIADWSKILQNRGATVDGGLHFPSARELAGVDVLVIYKGDAGYVGLEDRANLDQYLRRGGGIISLHDGLCSDDTAYFSNIVGGAKKHGEVNYTLEANVPYTIVDTAHPMFAPFGAPPWP